MIVPLLPAVALILAAGVGTVIRPAWRRYVHGAAVAFALGVLVRLALVVGDQASTASASPLVTQPVYAAGVGGHVDHFSLGWLIITTLGMGILLLGIERAAHAGAEPSRSRVALAMTISLALKPFESLVAASRWLEDERYLPAAIFIAAIVTLVFVR